MHNSVTYFKTDACIWVVHGLLWIYEHTLKGHVLKEIGCVQILQKTILYLIVNIIIIIIILGGGVLYDRYMAP